MIDAPTEAAEPRPEGPKGPEFPPPRPGTKHPFRTARLRLRLWLGLRLSRRDRRRILFALLALVVLWILASAVMVLIGLVEAGHGIDEVRQAKGRLSASDIVSEGALGPLRAARGDFSSSAGLLHSPVLVPFEVLPVLGRQLRSVQDLSSAAERTTQIGIGALGQVRAVLDVPHQGGPDRVATLRRLERLATGTDAQLSSIDPGPSNALLSPLAQKRASFVSQLDDVRTRLAHAATVADVTAQILDGPKTYLVLMANPAEMRSGSGAFLEVGVISSLDGQVHLTSTVPSATLTLPPAAVPVTGDLEARWGWTDPGVDWRSLGLTPQFDVTAPLALQMWEASTGQQLDGVLAVDVQALAQILKVTGPVTLPSGQVVSAETVVPLLTHDQYAGLTDEQTPSGAQAQQARQDELGALAHSALSALDDESVDLKALANAMTVSTGGRHILLYSRDTRAESAWREGGVAGQLESNSLIATVINAGANKLDQYLKVSCDLGISARGSVRAATLAVELQNETPSGQSQFIAGPYPGLGTQYGEYVGLVAVNLPSGVSHVSIDGNPPVASEGPEGPTWLVATPVDVKKDESQTVVVHFDLPTEHGHVTVVPSARLDPVPWSYPNGSTTDAAPFAISW